MKNISCPSNIYISGSDWIHPAAASSNLSLSHSNSKLAKHVSDICLNRINSGIRHMKLESLFWHNLLVYIIVLEYLKVVKADITNIFTGKLICTIILYEGIVYKTTKLSSMGRCFLVQWGMRFRTLQKIHKEILDQ